MNQVSLRKKCPNTELFLGRIQSEYRKIRTRNNSVSGRFSRGVRPCFFFEFPLSIEFYKKIYREIKVTNVIWKCSSNCLLLTYIVETD